MARSQLKTDDATPKPLLIRGDRLLLALDVLAAIFQEKMPGIDPTQARTTIGRLLHRERDDLPQFASLHAQLRADQLRALLRSAGGTLQHATFDARILIGELHHEGLYHFDEYIDCFFSAIASGELTEKDFKEEGMKP